LIRVALFLTKWEALWRKMFMLLFRPMIGSPHSMYTFYHPGGKVLGVAIYIGHRVSMKDKAEAGRSFLYLGGIRTLSPQSFYLVFHNER